VYLSFLVIFEIGSVICAAAPSSVALIAGRAVCGIGTAGIFSGVLNIIAYTIPLEKRPGGLAFLARVIWLIAL
jgi:predicted MFS family arabinose efflux permease